MCAHHSIEKKSVNFVLLFVVVVLFADGAACFIFTSFFCEIKGFDKTLGHIHMYLVSDLADILTL